MKVSMEGYTRYVVLLGDKAIKIPRFIGALRLVMIPLRVVQEGGINLFVRKVTKKGTRGPMRAILDIVQLLLVGGLQANRRECALYRAHPEFPVAPVMRAYLGGLIIVMPRGEPLADGEHCPFTAPDDIDTDDLLLPRNVCRFGREFRFVDYGTPGAERILTFLFSHHA